LLLHVEELLHMGRKRRLPVALMLIGVQEQEEPWLVRDLIVEARSELSRTTEIEAFEIDNQTLALSHWGDLARHDLESVSDKLRSHLRADPRYSTEVTSFQLVSGLAIGETPAISAADLLLAAESASRLARVNGRATFVRRI
jgi:hypothetical protein